jgi:hypothetical protein
VSAGTTLRRGVAGIGGNGIANSVVTTHSGNAHAGGTLWESNPARYPCVTWWQELFFINRVRSGMVKIHSSTGSPSSPEF